MKQKRIQEDRIQIGITLPVSTANQIDNVIEDIGIKRTQFVRAAIDEKLMNGANAPIRNQTLVEMIGLVQSVEQKLTKDEYNAFMKALDQIAIAQGRG